MSILPSTCPGTDRFRVNIHRQRGGIEAAFRRMPEMIPSPRELGLPAAVEEFARKAYGLVLVTGPVGVGKTTTLLSLVEQINRERDCLIITIEDPIEYLYTDQRRHQSLSRRRRRPVPIFRICCGRIRRTTRSPSATFWI